MFLKHLDILSSRITLYNKGLLYHSSFISVLLSMIAFIIIIIVFIGQTVTFFLHLERPKLTYYNKFDEESGPITIKTLILILYFIL